MEAEQLKVFIRSEAGKGPARRLRSSGMIPAILYGPKTDTIKLSVRAAELKTLLAKKQDKKFLRLLIEDDGKTVEKVSIVRKFETHPLGGQLIHADFYEISMDQKVSFELPVHLKGTPLGVEQGGELQQQKRILRVSCLPSLLPEGIELDISQLNVGESLRVKDIKLADGISLLDAGDVSVVYIAQTRAAMKAMDDQPSAAAVQPEALKQKAPEKKAPAKKK
ncbi:MAG: 50S ribosomal protein L25 [Syntrophales bacterium]|nr:50S ribosomal protein L25 [Syntrophales bacterium]